MADVKFVLTIDVLKERIKYVFSHMYPRAHRLGKVGHYTIDDLSNQVIFELIKEEYKQYSPKQTVQEYIYSFDIDALNRKYTRAIQYAQHYRNENNKLIDDMFGFTLSELEPQDVSGAKKFEGHQYTGQEFWQLKMQAECKLLNKLHGHQIESSKKVSETAFRELFEQYALFIDSIEPLVNEPDQIIDRTYAYYGIETHFLIEFLYKVTLVAERHGFPKEIPVERILEVCSIEPLIPETPWCPTVYMADLCIVPKWDQYAEDIFSDNDFEWLEKEVMIADCKQLKNAVFQQAYEEGISFIHECTLEDKNKFIIENYWIWDYRPEYEWTSERIQYFRKLYKLCVRKYEQPHVK